MTDVRPPEQNDDDLAVRVRSGLDALAREAGPAPALTSAATQPARRTQRAWVTAGALVAVVGVLIAIVFAATRPDADQQVASGNDTTANGPRPLLDTHWWLTSATDGGESEPIPTTGTPDFALRFLDGGSCEGIDAGCYDGPRMEGSDACNGVTRKTAIEGNTISLGEDYGAHTAMACPGGLPDVMAKLFGSDEITYSIDGDELVLRSADGEVVLTYEAIDSPFGPTDSPVVDEGQLGEHAYRLVWQGSGLDFEATEWGRAGVGTDPGRINAMRDDIDGQHSYLFGIVPGTAARVVYEPTGGDPQEIEIYDVGDAQFAVIGEAVDARPDTWNLVAYDAAGNEIDRLRWG